MAPAALQAVQLGFALALEEAPLEQKCGISETIYKKVATAQDSHGLHVHVLVQKLGELDPISYMCLVGCEPQLRSHPREHRCEVRECLSSDIWLNPARLQGPLVRTAPVHRQPWASDLYPRLDFWPGLS